MAISTQYQNLNLIPGKSAPVVVHCSRGNVGDTVGFYLYDGDEPFYPTNVSIAVHGVRADGSVFGPYAVAVTSGSNLVTFELVTAMTSVAGAAIGELVISDSDQNQVGSANFGILVETTPYSSTVTYEDDLSIYQRILAYVQSIPASISGQIATEAEIRTEMDASIRSALSTEITERKDADTSLSNSISSEASTRATADANLQSQINQIVAPSGEAPSAAEVQNARIGADGVTYSTLGDAIRTQFTNVNDEINDTPIQAQFYQLNTFPQVRDFINGHLFSGVFDVSARKYSTSTTRLTIDFILYNKNDYILSAKTGYQLSRIILNSNNITDVKESTQWGTQFFMARNTFCLINVRKTDNTAIAPAESPLAVVDLKRYNDVLDYSIGNKATVKSISHRGYMADAPENTMPAFKLAVTRGFRCIESDVTYTKDGIPVMIHDATIDRTSNGTGNVADLTYDQLLTYDFGSWFNSSFAGTKIPTFKEYIHFCKQAQVEPQIEIKTDQAFTHEQLDELVDIVRGEGMIEHSIWTSYGHGYLEYIRGLVPNARFGYLFGWFDIDASIQMIQDKYPDAFLQTLLSDATPANIAKLKAAHIPLQVAVIDTIGEIINADPYITGILSNKFVASTELYANSVFN